MKIRSVGKCNQAKMLACRKRVTATLKKLDKRAEAMYESKYSEVRYKGSGINEATSSVRTAMNNNTDSFEDKVPLNPKFVWVADEGVYYKENHSIGILPIGSGVDRAYKVIVRNTWTGDEESYGSFKSAKGASYKAIRVADARGYASKYINIAGIVKELKKK